MVEKGTADIEALDDQIRNLRTLRNKWASGAGLTPEQLQRREDTIELLESVIRDLVEKRKQLVAAGLDDREK